MVSIDKTQEKINETFHHQGSSNMTPGKEGGMGEG